MAFDQSTRNRLQNFVAAGRALLTEEFTRQLQHEYGLDPSNGTVSGMDKLAHLDDARLETARLLRDSMEHYRAASPSGGIKGALGRIVREQAFTVLNRLCALRMAEARGILIESIGNGYNSKGFQLYSRIAGTGLGETGDAYRCYLFSVFDELAVGLAVLFDRYSPMGRLFPREMVLLELLDMVNAPDIAPLWAEDETIGWIYQYFNSVEERRQMRAESQAPRNSRELAVRNQFFTPRYVVEFLTDNTLGRIWYEMTKGQTALKDSCRYLVRRPNEVFLAPGEEAPEGSDGLDELSQEELLQQPVFIPHRPLKDPRDILMLDPACGSMHFGLYAFDLYEQIYLEAWHWEGQYGADALLRSEGLRPLHDTFSDESEFRGQIPRLVIEHNIHGVDIDPRAAQIAGLSLWLRAQRSWKELGVKPQARPRIEKSNIVCAEPMPGEKDLLREFAASLKPRVLGQLLEIIFEKMELAGEAGSLLKIEEEIEAAVEMAREEFGKELKRRREGKQEVLFEEYRKPEQMGLFDFEDLPNRTEFWEDAEKRILHSLEQYAEQVEVTDSSRRRLFAQDAAKGFAFIDLCRKRFDVVLMNPPFGEPSKKALPMLKKSYKASYADIDAAFLDRALKLISSHSNEGLIGGIYNRTQFFKGYLADWRDKNILIQRKLNECIDLGLGVLDSAMVEASAYTTGPKNGTSSSIFISSLPYLEKESAINESITRLKEIDIDSNTYIKAIEVFGKLPEHRISYWVSPGLLSLFGKSPALEPKYGYARQGLITSDNFRFLRLVWESPLADISHQPNENSELIKKRWFFYAKGGEYSPYYGDIHLVVNWENEGYEIRNFFKGSKLASRPQNISFYFKEALTYTERTASDLSVRVLPKGCIFDCKGPIIAPGNEKVELLGLLGLTNSKVFKYFVELSLAGGDSSVPVGAARQFTQSIVGSVPIPNSFNRSQEVIKNYSQEVWELFALNDTFNETSRFFVRPWADIKNDSLEDFTLRLLAQKTEYEQDKNKVKILDLTEKIEDAVMSIYSLKENEVQDVVDFVGIHPNKFAEDNFLDLSEIKQISYLEDSLESIIKEFTAKGDISRAITKMSFYADRRVEILANVFQTKPASIFQIKQRLDYIRPSNVEKATKSILSYLLGMGFGVWNIGTAIRQNNEIELPKKPFKPFTITPPSAIHQKNRYSINHHGASYNPPVKVNWKGIMVGDQTNSEDILLKVRDIILLIWGEKAGGIEQEACEILSVKSLRDYFSNPNYFFDDHLKRYSKSRRQAPIYWMLSTPSYSYTLWLYYHRLNDQTLYTCVNDFVDPKLKEIREELSNLRQNGQRTREEEDELERLTNLELELQDFREELLRVARFWKPNLNDGVQITAAPLWKVTPHRAWQKKLKETWQKLEKGEYDWAHLAYSIWPERVIRTAQKDRSIAIAHGLEEALWEEVEVTDKRGKANTEWRAKELSDKQLKEIIGNHAKQAS